MNRQEIAEQISFNLQQARLDDTPHLLASCIEYVMQNPTFTLTTFKAALRQHDTYDEPTIDETVRALFFGAYPIYDVDTNVRLVNIDKPVVETEPPSAGVLDYETAKMTLDLLINTSPSSVKGLKYTVGSDNYTAYIKENGLDKFKLSEVNGEVMIQIAPTDDMRVCQECGETKNKSDFYARHRQCKACYNKGRNIAKSDKLSKDLEKIFARYYKKRQLLDNELTAYLDDFKIQMEELTDGDI